MFKNFVDFESFETLKKKINQNKSPFCLSKQNADAKSLIGKDKQEMKR